MGGTLPATPGPDPTRLPAGSGPVQPAQPRRVGSAVLRAAGAGAAAYRVLRGPQAQGRAALQHDRALLQVQLRPRPAPTGPALRQARPRPRPAPARSAGLYLRTPVPKPTWGHIKGGERTGVCVFGLLRCSTFRRSQSPAPSASSCLSTIHSVLKH